MQANKVKDEDLLVIGHRRAAEVLRHISVSIKVVSRERVTEPFVSRSRRAIRDARQRRAAAPSCLCDGEDCLSPRSAARLSQIPARRLSGQLVLRRSRQRVPPPPRARMARCTASAGTRTAAGESLATGLMGLGADMRHR